MNQIKGMVTRVTQCSGCLQVTVVGEEPGTFIIDNCCVWSIVDAEGANWIGRWVEYVDGYMRFLDRQVKPRSQLRRGTAKGP
jgi:hypothetical protein